MPSYDDYKDAQLEARFLRGKLGLPQAGDDTYRPVDDVYEEVRDLRARAIRRNKHLGWEAQIDAETAMLREEFESRDRDFSDDEVAARAAAAAAKFSRGGC
jgi:hypothetical protein